MSSTNEKTGAGVLGNKMFWQSDGHFCARVCEQEALWSY